ncbi:MAG: prenyltransferase [Chitinophagales bacterium]|nr:MAG: prenyltransferase [Chitinophagales bacterium]
MPVAPSVYLKFIRWKNLLLIALTQLLVRFFIIKPVFAEYRLLEHSLSDLAFLLVVAATMCIAAAGYIINDYFDTGMDHINKPMQVMVGRYFSKKEALRMHLLFNAAGVALGLFAAFCAGNIQLGFVFVIAAGLLWFYARIFKKTFLLGNMIVALLTSLVVLLPSFFETHLFVQTDVVTSAAALRILIPTAIYSLFAFLATLIREIIKDVEDLEGDKQFGSQSIPASLGIKTTKAVVTILILLFAGLLFIVQRALFRDDQLLGVSYIFIALQLPALSMIFYLIPAKDQADFHKLSSLMKVIMLLGVISMPLFHYFR